MVRLDLSLPAEPAAVTAARSCIGSLERVLDPTVLEDAKLVVSELVGNSIRHAGMKPSDEVQVHVEADGAHIRLSVRDSGEGFEPANSISAGNADLVGGWGLYLVNRVSGRWHVEREDGTCVCVELGARLSGSHEDGRLA